MIGYKVQKEQPVTLKFENTLYEKSSFITVCRLIWNLEIFWSHVTSLRCDMAIREDWVMRVCLKIENITQPNSKMNDFELIISNGEWIF